MLFNIICTYRQCGQRGKVLKDKDLFCDLIGLLPPSWVDRINFLVLLSDDSKATLLSFFKCNSPSSLGMGFFCADGKADFEYFSKLLRELFFLLLPPPPHHLSNC